MMVPFAGVALVQRFSITDADVCYLSMPLFHSNALMAGWAVALAAGGGDGAGDVLRLRPARRPAPLRRHLHELRRQAAGLRAGHPGAARRPRQPAAGGVRQRGHRTRHRRIRPPLRLHGLGRIRLHRGRGDHHPGRRLPARFGRPRLPRRGRSTTRETLHASARRRVFDAPARWPTPTRRSARSSTPPAPGCSAATTTTRKPPANDCATACTGPATWPTATPTAGSTWPGAPVTGCGWTARTWPARRSNGFCIGCEPVSRVAVYAVPDEQVGDAVMAALVLRDGAALTPEQFGDVPGRPARSVAQGLAALRLDRRRSARHRDQQDHQARAVRPWRTSDGDTVAGDPRGRGVRARRGREWPGRRAFGLVTAELAY